MKNVMTIAWEIAKEAVAKFGGKVKEYFAQSLKIAWATIKSEVGSVGPNSVEIELSEGSRNHKTWVAKLTGKDTKWGFKREFIDARTSDEYRGKWFTLEEGVYYDVQCGRDGRSYMTVKNGEAIEVSADEVKAALV